MNEKDAKALLVIVLGFSAIGILTEVDYLLYGALAVGALGVTFEKLGGIIVKGWLFLGEKIIGFVMSRIILSLVFFLILSPIAFLYRLTNKNVLQLDKPSGSIFIDRNHTYTKKDLKNIW